MKQSVVTNGKLGNKVQPVTNRVTTSQSISPSGPVRKVQTHTVPEEVNDNRIKEYGRKIIGSIRSNGYQYRLSLIHI